LIEVSVDFGHPVAHAAHAIEPSGYRIARNISMPIALKAGGGLSMILT
jgi:hypothetical protein